MRSLPQNKLGYEIVSIKLDPSYNQLCDLITL